MAADAVRDLGLSLHSLVADLDPIRWKDEKRAQLAVAFSSYHEDAALVLDQWSPDRGSAVVQSRLNDVQSVVDRLPSADDVKARWMEFRAELHPAYEDLAAALKTAHMELPSVRPTNYWRSTFHVGGAVAAVFFVEYSPWLIVIVLPFLVATFFWFLEIMRRRSEQWNDFLMQLTSKINHPHERHHVNSSTWFATALSILALTHEPIAGAAAVTVLGFGDPVAGFIGRRYGRIKLVHGRSLEGTTAFAVVSFITVLAVLFLWHPELSFPAMVAVCAVASIGGAITELFSHRVDDNFSIPMVVGFTVWATLALVS